MMAQPVKKLEVLAVADAVPDDAGEAAGDAQPTTRTAVSTEPIANGDGLLTPALSRRAGRREQPGLVAAGLHRDGGERRRLRRNPADRFPNGVMQYKAMASPRQRVAWPRHRLASAAAGQR